MGIRKMTNTELLLPRGRALAAPVDLNGPGDYVHWGVIQLSVANLVVIGLMVVVFVAALLLPFPGGRR